MYILVFSYDTSFADKKIITDIFSTNQNIFISKTIFCFIFLIFLISMVVNFFIYKDSSDNTNLLYRIFVIFFILYLIFLSELGDFFNKTAVERYTDYINNYVTTSKNVSKFINGPNLLIEEIFNNLSNPINQLTNTSKILQQINQNNVNTNNVIQTCNTIINSTTNQAKTKAAIIYQNYYLSFVLNIFNSIQTIVSNNLQQYEYILSNINRSTSYISDQNNVIHLNNNTLNLYFNGFSEYLRNYANKLSICSNCENYIDTIINYQQEPVYNQAQQAFKLSNNLLITNQNNQLYYIYIGYDIGFNIDVSNFKKVPLKQLNDDLISNNAKILFDKQLANNDPVDLYCCYNDKSVFIYYNEVFLLLNSTNLGTYIIKGYKDTVNNLYIVDSIDEPSGKTFKIEANNQNLFDSVVCINKFVDKDNIKQLEFQLANQKDILNSYNILPITLKNNLFSLNISNSNTNTISSVNFDGTTSSFNKNITTVYYSINNFPSLSNTICAISFDNYPATIIINNKNSKNDVYTY